MSISLSCRLSHWAMLHAGSVYRARRKWRKSLLALPRTRSSFLAHILRLSVLALLALGSFGPSGATSQPNASGVKESSIEMGAPCTTLTDIEEGTCRIEVRSDRFSFTNRVGW